MRFFALLFAFAFLDIGSSAADRQIGFVQQEEPGQLVIVTVVQTGKKNVVTIRDFRSASPERRRSISKEDFDSLWSAFAGDDAAAFAFQQGNMSDVGFYTVKLIAPKKNLSLRFPSESLPSTVAPAIEKIRAWIDEKKG
jgi:hypothetical protein